MINSNLKSKIIHLSNMGIDVSSLLEWYIEEKNLNEGIGDWFKKAGDWVKDQWSNLRYAKNNWGSSGKNLDSKDKGVTDYILGLIVDLKQKYGNQVEREVDRVLTSAIEKLETLYTGSSANPRYSSTIGANQSGFRISDPYNPSSVDHSGYSDVGSFKTPKSVSAKGEKGRFVKSTGPMGVSSFKVDPDSKDYSFRYGDSTNIAGLKFNEWFTIRKKLK